MNLLLSDADIEEHLDFSTTQFSRLFGYNKKLIELRLKDFSECGVFSEQIQEKKGKLRGFTDIFKGKQYKSELGRRCSKNMKIYKSLLTPEMQNAFALQNKIRDLRLYYPATQPDNFRL